MPNGWEGYYAATEHRPPRPTLLRALDRFAAEPAQAPRLAIDLGCGSGRDTIEILQRGWRTVGIDADANGLQRLEARLPPEMRALLELRQEKLEAAALPPADLINASFVLMFLDEQAFAELWRRVRIALRPGGRFAGHLLAPRDSWVVSGRCFGLDLIGIAGLTESFRIEGVEEEENDGVTPRGEAKHWHLWHLNLRRI